jgi:hypothetical protein
MFVNKLLLRLFGPQRMKYVRSVLYESRSFVRIMKARKLQWTSQAFQFVSVADLPLVVLEIWVLLSENELTIMK